MITIHPSLLPQPLVMLLVTSLILPSCRTIEEEAMASTFDQPAFARADADSDGKVSKTELARHHHREALAEFDLDNDNHISASEWAAAKPSAGENDPHFNQLDKNSDGRVAEDEAVLFLTEHVGFGNAFSKMDQNGDFHLHWEEIDEAAPSEVNVTLFSIQPES